MILVAQVDDSIPKIWHFRSPVMALPLMARMSAEAVGPKVLESMQVPGGTWSTAPYGHCTADELVTRND